MRRFRYLRHTADMQFRAYGPDFTAALENSALALLNIMLDIRKIAKDGSAEGTVQVKDSADNEHELVWFILQDILSTIDSRKLNAYSFRVLSLRRGRRISLKGTLSFKRTSKDYSLLSVKAVTPHDLVVNKKNSGVSINVVVDV